METHNSVDGWGTNATNQKVTDLSPYEVIEYFSLLPKKKKRSQTR
jgi:hypothetical protein